MPTPHPAARSIPRLYSADDSTPGAWWRPHPSGRGLQLRCPKGHRIHVDATAERRLRMGPVIRLRCMGGDCDFAGVMRLEDAHWRGPAKSAPA